MLNIQGVRPSSSIVGLVPPGGTPGGFQTLASGASIMISPTNRDRLMTQFVVANMSTVASGLILVIADTSGNYALPVFPQTVITLETDSEFKLINDPTVVGSISYIVGQLFLRATGNFIGEAGASSGVPTSTSGLSAATAQANFTAQGGVGSGHLGGTHARP